MIRIPTSLFWSYARARTQNEQSYWTFRSLKVEWEKYSYSSFLSSRILKPFWKRRCSRMSGIAVSQPIILLKNHRKVWIQPCLHGYPEHLASREAPVITLLAIYTADKLTLSFRENVWALTGGGGGWWTQQERRTEREARIIRPKGGVNGSCSVVLITELMWKAHVFGRSSPSALLGNAGRSEALWTLSRRSHSSNWTL